MKNQIKKVLSELQKKHKISEIVMINIEIQTPQMVCENEDLSIEQLENSFGKALFFLCFDSSANYFPLNKYSILENEIFNFLKTESII